MLLRLGTIEATEKWARLEVALLQLGELLLGRYVVIDERRIRSRPLLKAVPLAGE